MSTKEKLKLAGYWVATLLTAANFAFGGFMYLSRTPEVIAGLAQLGYPAYFASILGFWKALGAIAITIPRFPLLKEWAYAGMFFNLTGAAATNAFAGSEIGHVVAPIAGLLVLAASWALRPASRRIVTSV